MHRAPQLNYIGSGIIYATNGQYAYILYGVMITVIPSVYFDVVGGL